MSFSCYPMYKASRVEWLGQVPEHWEIRRVKTIFEIKKRIAGIEGFNVLSITQQGIKIKDIESGGGQLSMDYSKYQLIEPGDFGMNHMDLLTGYVDISQYDGVLSPDYRVFSSRNKADTHDPFFLYLFQLGYRAKIFFAYGQGSSQLGRWRMPTEQFNELAFPFPPFSEQKAIAAFLDRELARIGALVTEQQRLIALLAEKRQAIISHAVTKGLNPTVPMKDSGVEWLGEVPEHWNICKFQRCVSVSEGQVDPELEPFASMILVAPNHVESRTGRLLSLETAAEQGAESGKYLCKAGDVIYSKIRPALRKACIAPLDCICSADMYPLRAHSGLTNAFLFRFILSEVFSMLAVLESERVAMPKINRESLRDVVIAFPDVNEQVEICHYLEVETSTVDNLIEQAEQAITLLQERRTALISAAVTGQIDVRTKLEALAV